MRGGSLQSRTRAAVAPAMKRRRAKEADDPVIRSLMRHLSCPTTQSLQLQGLGPSSTFKLHRTAAGWSGAGRVSAVTWQRMRERVIDHCQCVGGKRCALDHRGTEGHQHKFSAVFRCTSPVAITVSAIVGACFDEPTGEPPSAVLMRTTAGRELPFAVVLGHARPWQGAAIVDAGNVAHRESLAVGLWAVGQDWHAQRSYEE